MTYGFYVNGEKRMPTPEEAQVLLDRFMEKLGYERAEPEKEKQEERAVV